MTNRSLHRGFTLVELTLVMAFLSVLLLAILMTTLQIGKLYTKGVTNRTINQIGRDLSDTLRRDFLTASPDRIVITTPTGSGTATSGRLCLGSVSYAWNTADLINQTGSPVKMTKSGSPIVLERVVDASNQLCTIVPGPGTYITDIPSALESANVLAGDGRSIAIYDFTVTELDVDGKNGLYELKITIGTNDPGTTQRNGTEPVQCKPPTDSSSDFNYCSVADFDIIVRTGGDGR